MLSTSTRRVSAVCCHLLHHETGDDTRHLASGPEGGIRHGGHQAHISRPVNHPDASLSQQGTQFTGGIEVGGIYLGTRSAVHTYGIYLVHRIAIYL